ncbi:hypothetical protein VTI28DRAFT_2509 [Corynascus sepedonium]
MLCFETHVFPLVVTTTRQSFSLRSSAREGRRLIPLPNTPAGDNVVCNARQALYSPLKRPSSYTYPASELEAKPPQPVLLNLLVQDLILESLRHTQPDARLHTREIGTPRVLGVLLKGISTHGSSALVKASHEGTRALDNDIRVGHWGRSRKFFVLKGARPVEIASAKRRFRDDALRCE